MAVMDPATQIAIVTGVGAVVAAGITGLAASMSSHKEEASVCSVRLRVVPGHYEECRSGLPWMPVQTRWVPDRYERLAEFRDGTRRWVGCSRLVFDSLRTQAQLPVESASLSI